MNAAVDSSRLSEWQRGPPRPWSVGSGDCVTGPPGPPESRM